MIDFTGLPNRPKAAPLDWEQKANAFDQFIMDPANHVLFKTKKGETAFTSGLFDDQRRETRHELITFAPIVLGKYLRGEEASELAPFLRMYFDEQAGIFLNSPGSRRIEMWYLLNILSLATHTIRCLMMEDEFFVQCWRSTANRLLELGHQLDYNFNHQGYHFGDKVPWTRRDIFRQPDVIGAYGYQMLLAYTLFNDSRYLDEARIGIERYLSFSENPWYEIPSAAMALAAAAHLRCLGHEVNVGRALEFLFDPGAGMANGTWGGEEVNGLVRGWKYQQQNPDSVYSMESLVVLPYLLPVARRMPSLARLIGKYALNVAANARLFYSGSVPHDSRPGFATAVPYERLYENYAGLSPYASGDFGAQRSIYGGAYSLWWGALVRQTGVPSILQLNLVASDFLERGCCPACLYYNPYPQKQFVTVALPEGRYDLYDLGDHRTFKARVSGQVKISLPAEDARVIAVIPSAAIQHVEGTKLLINGHVVDWAFPRDSHIV